MKWTAIIWWLAVVLLAYRINKVILLITEAMMRHTINLSRINSLHLAATEAKLRKELTTSIEEVTTITSTNLTRVTEIMQSLLILLVHLCFLLAIKTFSMKEMINSTIDKIEGQMLNSIITRTVITIQTCTLRTIMTPGKETTTEWCSTINHLSWGIIDQTEASNSNRPIEIALKVNKWHLPRVLLHHYSLPLVHLLLSIMV